MNIKILSRNSGLYCTARLIEAAKKRKHNVEVIDPLKCDLIIEKKKIIRIENFSRKILKEKK